MKDQKILILLMFSFMFTSCGITFPYLNEQNERFDKIYKGKIYIDENISRTCFEFDVVARKFKHQPYYILQISQMSYKKELPCPYISVVLHSLIFLNKCVFRSWPFKRRTILPLCINTASSPITIPQSITTRLSW